MKTAFILNFLLQVEICMAVTSSVNTPSYTATSWLHLTHIDKDLHASAGVIVLSDRPLWWPAGHWQLELSDPGHQQLAFRDPGQP